MVAPFSRCFALSLLFAPACAATTGRAWVNEPEEGNPSATVPARELAPTPAAVALAPNVTELDSEARPRLSHVVSLGQSESDAARPSATLAPGGAPGVVVNIVNYVGNPSSGGYGYPTTYRSIGNSGYASAPPTMSSRGGTPALGGDWGRAPSYGPSFPYHTAPASPWERSRR